MGLNTQDNKSLKRKIFPNRYYLYKFVKIIKKTKKSSITKLK